MLLWNVSYYCVMVLHIKIKLNRSDLNLCLQPVALVILKLGMIEIAVSNWR